MSSINMKSTEEECYPRDSLDRYGDDLCEEILSYLSLEDCFRFECLSKQWKRSVFAKRSTLELDYNVINKLVSRESFFTDMDIKRVESMVKSYQTLHPLIPLSTQRTRKVYLKYS